MPLDWFFESSPDMVLGRKEEGWVGIQLMVTLLVMEEKVLQFLIQKGTWVCKGKRKKIQDEMGE